MKVVIKKGANVEGHKCFLLVLLQAVSFNKIQEKAPLNSIKKLKITMLNKMTH